MPQRLRLGEADKADRLFARQPGQAIRLRNVLADCSPRYLGWLNDAQVNRYLETRFAPQSMPASSAGWAMTTSAEMPEEDAPLPGLPEREPPAAD